MSVGILYKMLCAGKKFIKINQNLLNALDIEQATLYSYLVSEYQKSIKKEDYKYFGNDIYIYCPVDVIEEAVGLSAFRQRNVLNSLQKKNLLKVKFGKSRTRYICINEDTTVLEHLLYGSKIDSLKANFEKYIRKYLKNAAEEFIEEYSLKKENKIDKQLFFEMAKKSDLYNNFSEINLKTLSQLEETQKQNEKKMILK